MSLLYQLEAEPPFTLKEILVKIHKLQTECYPVTDTVVDDAMIQIHGFFEQEAIRISELPAPALFNGGKYK